MTDVSSVASTAKAGFGFGRQGEKAAGLKGTLVSVMMLIAFADDFMLAGYLISKPVESLPRYAPSMKASGSL